jgi:SAM-dependent methyltransferase
VRRVFEPACGTGRLLFRLAKAGLQVSGLDLNQRAVAYCNARLQRHGFPASVRVANMSDFRLPKPVDACFNMINSFRHLLSENEAEKHLRSVARNLSRGGLYILGLHLTPTRGEPEEEESWSARRGHLQVNTQLKCIARYPRKREEHFLMECLIYTPLTQRRLSEQLVFRSYTARQFATLLAKVPELSIAATHDFSYDAGEPLPVGATAEDVVYVLRKVS